MKRFLLQFSKRLLVLLLALTLSSFQFNEENIREPFADYKVEQPAPSKAPIDWNSLDYNDAMWGWYYKQLWWLYHPNGNNPPWLNNVPIGDGFWFLLGLSGIFLYYQVTKQRKICIYQK